MAYPFLDKTSSYVEAYGFYDSSGEVMSPITAINRAVSAASGVTIAVSSINNMIYGSASRILQFTAISIYDGEATQASVALNLTAINTVWVQPTSGGTSMFLNVWATQTTQITFRVYLAAGSAVTAGTAQPVYLFGLGTPV